MDLVEIEGNPIPEGAEVATLAAPGAALRYATWSGGDRGTVLFLSGRNEFIEKHLETVEDLIERGFNVATLDWRGQGLSTRPLVDRLKGHIDSFDTYADDLHRFVDGVLSEFPGPYGVLAHSMGGHIALRWLAETTLQPEWFVATAPMVDIRYSVPRAAMRAVARTAIAPPLARRYAPTRGAHEAYVREFEGNILTADRRRYDWIAALWEANNDLRLAGPTLGWLHAAIESIDRLTAPGYGDYLRARTLIVAGANDRVVDNNAQRELTRRMPDAEWVEIAGSEHEILSETDEIRAAFWSHFDRFVD